jgi:hypothetical protein
MSIDRQTNTCASQILAGALGLVLFVATASSLQADQIVLKKGTPVKLVLGTTVSSETAKIGDMVEFKVAEDVKVGDFSVVPAGSKGRGFVAKTESGKLFGAGALNIYIGSVGGPSGLQIPVYGLLEASNNGADAVLTQGTEGTAQVDIDVPIDTEIISSTRGKAPPARK